MSARVLFVSTAQAGGAERVLIDLLDGLGPDWIAGVALTHDGPLLSVLAEAGVGARVLTGDRRSRIGQLRRIVRELRPDLVHANGIAPALEARVATVGTSVGVLWMRHDLSHAGAVSRILGTACRRVVGVSDVTARGTTPLRHRRAVVYNGLSGPEPDAVAGRAAVARLAPGADVTLGVIGRLCPGKGQLVAIDALARLVAQRPESQIRLLLVGGEDHFFAGFAEELHARVAAAGLAGRVVFCGHREDARDLVAGLDVVWVPSVRQRTRDHWQEGFGLVAAEALWAGTPVVVTRHGALPEVVGPCGVVVAEDDPAALARATANLLDDVAERTARSASGRARAAALFAPERALGAMTGVYDGMVGA